jgi:hypothetical protein
MNWKHTKFDESVVMRSLEKLAKEKGMVKEKDLTKTASVKKLDLSPSSSLTINLMKLSAGLRAEGLSSYADELETKFTNYKYAQTLYDTHGEKGEDLIDAAHPKGSHKLEDVDSTEAVFETILDQHLQNVKMIDKKPTGKLANHSIINQVKKVLGAEESIYDLCKKAWNQFNNAFSRIKLEVDIDSDYYNDVVNHLDSPTLEGLKEAQLGITKVYNYVQPTSLNSVVDILKRPLDRRSWTKVSDQNWAVVQPMLNSAYNLIGQAINQLIESGQSAPTPPSTSVDMSKFDKQQKENQTNVDSLSNEIAATMDKINKWLYLPEYKNIQNDKSLVAWINQEYRTLSNLLSDSHSRDLYDRTLQSFQQEKQYIQDVESKYTKRVS